MKSSTLRCSDAINAKCHPAMCECVSKRMRALESVARAALDGVDRTRGRWAMADVRLRKSLERLAKCPRRSK